MKNNHDYLDTKITMASAITHLGLQNQFEIVSVSKDYTCPFCNKRKKFNINFRKDVYKCWSCNETGNGIIFWAKMRGFGDDLKSAGLDYRKYLLENENIKEVKLPKENEYQAYPEADIKRRDICYRALLDTLALTDKHRANLMRRGLTDEDILKYGYKSAPEVGIKNMCHNLLSKGIALEGVPGFYKNKEWEFIYYGSGFIIPTKDIQGRIQALQIRRDKTKGGRYLTVSSDGKMYGAKGHTYPHISNTGKLKEIILTEGPLKADITSKFTGMSALAVLGVNSVSYLPSVLRNLKENGTRYINIAFDMDLYTNENVEKALLRIKEMISKEGFRYCQLDWDKNFKGIDDYLSYREY